MGYLMPITLLTICLAQFSPAFLLCPGCPVSRDVNDPTIRAFLLTALSGYSSPPNGTDNEKIELTELKKVTTQIVSGIKTTFDFDASGVKTHRMYNCHLVILARPWLEGDTVLSYNCQHQLDVLTKLSVVGGETQLDVRDNAYLNELKSYIEQQFIEQQKSTILMEVVKFVKASQQIVAGIKTRATVEIASTNCPVENTSNRNCTSQPNEHQLCNIEIWDQPWRSMKEMTVKDCKKVPYFCGGCPVELNPDNEQANQCLKRTLYNVNTEGKSQKQWELLRIIKVEEQVVAGLKYTIEFEAEDQTNSLFLCRAVIVSQPWASSEPLVDEFSCSPEKK